MKLSFAQKLWLPLILGVLCLAGISIYNAYQVRDARLAERKADLKHASEIALSVVRTFGDQVTAGSIPVGKPRSGRWQASGTCGTARTAISRFLIRTRRS